MSPDLNQLLENSVWVRRLARSLVADPNAADDLVQEAWVVALEKHPLDVRGPSLKRWFTGVLRNLARDRRRRDGRRSAREQDVARPDNDGGGDQRRLDQLETHSRIVEAVRRLDEPYRAVVLMRYFDGASPAKISREQDVPLRTVYSQLNRGLSQLRERLRRDFGGASDSWLLALLPLSTRGSGWTLGTLTGAVVMNAKLKIAFTAIAIAGAAALATIETGAVPSPTLAAVTTPAQPERPADIPMADQPLEVTSRSDRAPAAPEASVPEAEADLPVDPAPETFIARGRVINIDRTPAAGVALEARAQSSTAHASTETSAHASARTQADGGFQISTTHAQVQVVVSDDRYTTVLQPHAGETFGTPFLIVVALRQSLAGIVVDASGVPVPGAKLVIDLHDPVQAGFGQTHDDSDLVRWRATSAQDGRFQIPDAPRTGDGILVTTCAGFARDMRPLPLEPTYDFEVVLGLKSDGDRLLEGTVVDAEGRPVEGAKVAIEFKNGSTDAQGHFALQLQGEGKRGILMAIKAGNLPARLERTGSSNVEAGAWPDPLVLTLGGPPLTIRGRVLDAQGKPGAGLTVWTSDTTHFGAVEMAGFGPRVTVAADVESLLGGSDRWNRRVTTDPQGYFTLHGLLPNDYRISTHDLATGTFHLTAPVAAGTQTLVIELPHDDRHERVAGRVLGLDGEPVPGATIALCRLLDPADSFSETVGGKWVSTDEHGVFSMREISTSLTHVQIHGEGLGLENRFLIPQGADMEQLEFAVARHCRVRVQLEGSIEADEARFLNDAGEQLLVSVFRGNTGWSMPGAELTEGTSELITLSEFARTMVLYQQGDEVKRVPIELHPGDINELQAY